MSRLEPKDFRLLVDGEEVPIEYFTEIRDGGVIGSAIGVPELADAESVGTSFLIFIDEFLPLSNGKKRVLAAVAERAQNMRPEDRSAVVAWDGRRLVMLSDWTSSPGETTPAVEGAMERPSGGLHREAERSQWLYRPPATGVRRRGY